MRPIAARISQKQIKMLVKCFALDQRATDAAELADVNRNTANLYFRHFRECIFESMRKAPRLFGEVEADQSAFGGRGRKKMRAALKRLSKKLPHAEYLEKAKEIRKEHATQVFGLLQREGDVYTHIIRRADQQTLEPIIRLVVEPGSTIFSDEWRGFARLKRDKYKHRTVNHSESYVSKHGVHINGIESFWSFAKRRLAQFNGISQQTLPLHIKECEFRYNCRGKEEEEIKNLLRKKI